MIIIALIRSLRLGWIILKAEVSY